MQDCAQHLTSIQSEVRGYVLTGDPKYLGTYSDQANQARRELHDIRQLTGDNPHQQQRLDELEPAATGLIQLLDREVRSRASGERTAQEIIRTSGGFETMTRIRTIVAEMLAEENQLLLKREEEMRTASRWALIVISAGGILAFAIIVLAIWVMNRELIAKQRAQEHIQELNSQLQFRAAELAETNRELEAFTYSVSHDLRAPLRHIDGFSGILLEDYSHQLESTAKHYLQEVRGAGKNMGRLVDELLNLSRLGRQDLTLRRVNLTPIVQKAIRDLKREINGRRIEWRVDPLPTVECDPILMEQVFTNLLSNAVKYTRARETAVIEVNQTVRNGETVVAVADNGAGFDMKYADKLFGVFQRLHRQEDFEGVGVGLATVQRIVHRHHGQIWAEAEVDKGATFLLALPGLRNN